MKKLKCSFELPTRVEFGNGVINTIGIEVEKYGANKVLVVTDKGVIAAGLVEVVKSSLQSSGIPYVIYSDIGANPKDYEMDKAGDFAKREGVDFLVAIGGGSVIDSAKAIGTLLTHEGSVLDRCGVFKLNREITPLIAIPTTAGTGSEVTVFAVVTNSKKHIKESIWDTKVSPKVALVDPMVLEHLPVHIMASTGVDALTHAVEAYTCKESTPYTDIFALYAIELISQNLKKAVIEHDTEAHGALMLGSNVAGIAFGLSDVAAVHCMAEALGGRYDIPHGVANAMLLPTVCEFNLSADYEKYGNIAKAMGVDTLAMTKKEAAERCVLEIRNLCKDLGITTMKDLSVINPDDFKALAKAAQENTSTPSNPVAMTEEFYLNLFNRAYCQS